MRRYNLEQQQRKCERNIRKYTRLANGAIDADNAGKYTAKMQQWKQEYNTLIKNNGDVLRKDSARLRLYGIDKVNNSTFNTPISKYKGTKAEVSLKDATTIIDINKYWTKKGYSFNIPDDYDKKAIKDLSMGVSDTLEEFPFMKDSFKGFDTDEAYASASFTEGIIHLSEEYKKDEYGIVLAIERKNNGYHPNLNGYSGAYQTGCHEFGHGIVQKFANDKYGNENGWLYLSRDIEKSILNSAKKELGKNGVNMSMKELKATISEYATKRNGETISEAVADYMCNKNNASMFSKAIVAEIKRRVK